MRLLRLLLAVLMLSGAGLVWADRHGHSHARIYLGFPFAPWIYPPTYYYVPPQVIVTPSGPPPVYVEQPRAPTTGGFWYYCASSGAYYPYVKECPEGWMQESPKPLN